MRLETVVTSNANQIAKDHLLCFFSKGISQENLCFGLWYPSQGAERYTAVVREIVLPEPNETNLHGNASFEGRYLSRAVREAKAKGAGLVMMHSHPVPGWQDLSKPDIAAERDVVAYRAQSTRLPFVGMTIGTDGYWSARFWTRKPKGMALEWCDKVRVPKSRRYQIDWNPSVFRSFQDNPFLKRTIETWGIGFQQGIQQLHIGVVGLGSVGSILAESLARLGISRISLIDPDKLEPHNLDRFIFGKVKDVGKLKVELVKQQIVNHSTHKNVQVTALGLGIENDRAYREALDCDLIFSCVDRPVARDVLNYIAISSSIPVIDAGVAVELDPKSNKFESSRWRSHIVIPGNACLRCTGQYSSSDVVAELDGSLDDPSYIANLPQDQRPLNQNVFPFSLGCAGMQINQMIRYMLAQDWWPRIQRQEFRLIGGEISRSVAECHKNCEFRKKQGLGSKSKPSYLKESPMPKRRFWKSPFFTRAYSQLRKILS